MTLFVDVGGVLLTNGWDHHARKRAAKHFQLNWTETDERHRLVFETHEEGKLSFDEYLGWVVFYEKRSFTRIQFRDFMFAQSKPYPKMIGLLARLKAQHGLKIVVISNESREVNAYRIRTFRLDTTCGYVHLFLLRGTRKPDVDIFRLALDLAQTPTAHAIFMDNTPMFVQVAERLGIQGILHTDYKSTRAKLASFGIRDGRRGCPCEPAEPRILTVNGGSSSIKFALFEIGECAMDLILKGGIERIGLSNAVLHVKGCELGR